jgi:hypothetical protein
MNFVYFNVFYDYFLHPCGLHLATDLGKEKYIETEIEMCKFIE